MRSIPDDIIVAASTSSSGRHDGLAVLAPVLAIAARRLRRMMPLDPRISDGAMCGLLTCLYHRLLTVTYQALNANGVPYAVPHLPAGYWATLTTTKRLSTGSSSCLAVLWADLFSRYPEMSRLITLVVESWIQSSSEFLDRLIADWPAIRTLVNPSDISSVRSASGGHSDPHAGGRTVKVVEFDNGSRVVYKPRSVSAEACFAVLLAWIKEWDPAITLSGPRALDQGSYGWEEYVSHAPIDDANSAHRYYERAGSLLALCDTLGAVDLHADNLIACGDTPVLIDLEAVLQPRPNGFGSAGLGSTTQHSTDLRIDWTLSHLLGESVISTGLVPYPRWWHSRGAGRTIAGLEIVTGQTTCALDDVHCVERTNVPLLEGQPLLPSQYVESIIVGFERMNLFLRQYSSQLTRAGGPLEPFRSVSIRYIHRATLLYGKLIEASISQQCLRDATRRRDGLQRLAFALRLRAGVQKQWWQVLRDEIECLSRLDVPRLTARPGATSLWLTTGAEVCDCLVEPSYDAMHRRVSTIHKVELGPQIELIRAAFANDGNGHEAHASLADDMPATLAKQVGNSSVSPVPAVSTRKRPARLTREELTHLNWVLPVG